MKLTPIEELAIKHSILPSVNSLGRYAHHPMMVRERQAVINNLEALRQAIISDFVNGLEPDYIQLIDIDGHEHDNLFDLLEWRNK